MKVTCLVLCLALARHAAGHIFNRPRYPQMVAQYLESIDTPQWNQRDSHEHHHGPHRHISHQEWQNVQEVLSRQQKEQSQPQQRHDSSESNSRETHTIGNYAAPVFADVSQLTTDQKPATYTYNVPLYADPIAWKGVRIAAPKKSVDKEDIEKIFSDAYNNMNHVSEENKKIFHQAYVDASSSVDEDIHLNATELLSKYQYDSETHTIKTDDGYYLTLFRILPKEQIPVEQKRVVFLMHGLLGSADDWLLMGPGKSLAYLLADAGYEVWLGNARGNKYSRRHVSKHPATTDFWQYSVDDIALYDLPTMIDYALKTSDKPKLYYVGYSLGTTAFFALASTRPEYNEKIITMYALSPMAYMSNARSPLLRMIAPTSPFHENLREQLGRGEFKPSAELVSTVGGDMCQNEIGCPNVCSNVNFVMSGVNIEDMDVKDILVIMGHLPAGTSSRLMKQYAQAVASHRFSKYDFGAAINKMVYGVSEPPMYDMQKVQAPVALYYSEADWLAHPADVARLEKELPNVLDSYKVPQATFGNMDFQFSRKAPEVVYKRLIESMQQSQKQSQYVY